MKKQFSLKFKLIAIFLSVAIVPLLVANMVASSFSSKQIREQASERVRVVGLAKKEQVLGYFNNNIGALKDLASSSLIKSALKDFTEVHLSYEHNNLTESQFKKLEEFYTRTFSAKYSEMNPDTTFNFKEWMSSLDDITRSAQYDFIANNENPLGEKGKLLEPERQVPYSLVHAKYHEELGHFVSSRSLYDIFLVSPEGRVVYTYFKEVDFFTNLSRGPLADSGLGQAFANSLNLRDGSVHLEDFKAYGPSYEAPASFAAIPIYENSTHLGTLIIQLPLDKISQVASDRDGMGEKGQVLLLGSDSRLRADAFRKKETYNVAASFKKGSDIKIESSAVKAAIAGESGIYEGPSYDGEAVISFYQPLKIENQKWLIISELMQDEVYKGLRQIEYTQTIILIISILLISIVGWFVSVYIGKKLQSIIAQLGNSTTRVSQASTETSSTQLSSSVSQQASSVQQTMASAEEISAMISQNAESASKAKTTVEANDKATKDGSRAVDEMVVAIGEISDTNEKILKQMEASNKEFSEIVQIISEIGDKTKVINDIVFQTKLLSFNASVEAARAGEHGKGFAVVAEEVGNLAQMSGNAAKEITEMLSVSIKRVNGIVEQTKSQVEDLVEIGRDKVSVGESTASRCKTALDLLARNASTLTSMVTEIAHASKEQAQGVKEINSAISQLDQVTQQNSAVAQQSSVQAESLLSETYTLQRLVTDLAVFVEGSSSKSVSKDKKNNSDPVIKSKSETTTATVLPMRAKTTNAASSKGKNSKIRGEVAEANRMAAGSDINPSANHPKFEDF